MRTTLLTFFAAILLAATATATANNSSQTKEEQPGEIVAKVNGVPIYEKELNESLALRFKKKKAYGLNAKTFRQGISHAIQMQILNDLIDSAVIYQAAMSMENPPDVEEQVNQKILSLASTFGSEKKYDEFLSTKDTSLENKRAYYRKSYLVQAYFDRKGLTSPDIPEDDIKALYEQQKEGFKTPEQVKFSQIFIKVDKKLPPEEKKERKQVAEQARKMLLDGTNFADVTSKLSETTDLEITGGDRGYVRRGLLPQSVDDVAFSIMPWKISDVIESEFGYHVLMVSDKKPAGYSPYENVRDFLLRYLETEAVRENVATHTRELREKAKIEILLKKEEDNTASKTGKTETNTGS